jgi:predicted SAM-dependent methyltransferase
VSPTQVEVQPLRRLQLGTSRLELLSAPARKVFVDRTWVHLGEARRRNLKGAARRFIGWLPGQDSVEGMYRRTEFRPFWFAESDRLNFEDGHFSFIYSEHFFEHLTSAVSHNLFKEAYRLLRPGGVIRTVVPDAIFRTYEPPEPENFPLHLPEGDHNKHKTRWSVYSLTEALSTAGFRAIPLDYCTSEKQHVQRDVKDALPEYGYCADPGLIADHTYIIRVPSLIVDGIKE